MCSPGRHILLLPLFCLVGCPDRDSNINGIEPSGESAYDEINHLRSLGYIGVTDKTVDPNLRGVVKIDPKRAGPGCSLYCNRTMCSAELIDLRGDVLKTWRVSDGWHWENGELLDNGDLLVVGSDRVPGKSGEIVDHARYLMRLSWEGKTVWKRMMLTHHDVEVTPQDRILLLTFKYRRIDQISSDIDVRDDYLTLMSHNGDVLEERSLYEAFAANPDEVTIQPVAPNTKSERMQIDLFHSNSIEWMHWEHLFDKHTIYASTNVLICSRHQDTVAIIDWKTNRLLWAWGQGQIDGPHDAQMLENGHILLFDNGMARGWSRVIELDPLTKKIVWEYRAPNRTDFYTRARGACQRLPNGNTLVTDSDSGQGFEITADGEIVWEFLNPNITPEQKRITIFRMKRYENRYIEAILRRSRK